MIAARPSRRSSCGFVPGPHALLGLVAAASLSAAGCGLSAFAAKPDPTRFFVLAVTPASTGPGTLDPSRTVGLGPIEIPTYLQRPELVVRESATEIRPAAFDRWSEPLDKGIARVLAQQLSSQLGLDRVTHYPWYSSQEPTYQVRIELRSFEATAAGEVQVSARWEVKRLAVAAGHIQRNTVLTPRVDGGDTRDTVTALSAALAQLGTEIAGAVVALDAGGH